VWPVAEPGILWHPAADADRKTNIGAFQSRAAAATGRSFGSYRALHDWSIHFPEEFWGLLWDELEIRASQRWTRAIHPRQPMWRTTFFEGARLNFAENLLRHRDDRVAFIFRDEAGNRLEWTAAELWREVAATAAGLRQAGITAGDRIAGFVPNIPATLVAMLAATSIGAVWSSCSPDFGTSAVVDRFGQIGPRLLFAADGYRYNGKTFDLRPRIEEIAQRIPGIAQTVLLPYLEASPALPDVPGAISLADFQIESQDLEFAQLPFDHPLFILYTSGTTGVPKCIVHRAGGALIQLMKDHRLHCDLGAGDRLFFYTTCGWMMWNWLVAGLASDCTIVLYEGSPFAPEPDALWQLAESEQVTAFGAGARYLAAIENAGLEPGRDFDLAELRLLMSTGSVLPPEGYDYVYSHVKPDVLLASVTGGTDILSAFALGAPILPLYRGEMQCLALGMAVSVFNEQGQAVIGASGELVCTRPFPSMPLKFWNDEDNARYKAAYFERFPGVWHHGDFAELTERGGLIIHGRSDAVLNPGGVRIGTAEIYRQVDKLDEVLESVCIGQNWDNDVRVVLFVVLREGIQLTDELAQRIRDTIRHNTSPRHVPACILQVTDIPRTLSGKIAETAVRDTVNGRAVTNLDALANPEALAQFADRPELQLANPSRTPQTYRR
jgi:acetoacetyl-CoA synthetase